MTKGQKTKELLLEAAKEEFRELGFQNASVGSIAKRLGVQPSLFSYHYKNIPTVIRIINQNFHKEIWDLLHRQDIPDPMIFLFAYDLIVDIITYSTPESRRFKYESSKSNRLSMYALDTAFRDPIGIEDSYYDAILHYYQKAMSHETLYRLRMQESAGRREMFITYCEKDQYQKISEDDWYNLCVNISYCTITTVFRFAGISNELVDKKFNEAFELIGKLDLSHICLL